MAKATLQNPTAYRFDKCLHTPPRLLFIARSRRRTRQSHTLTKRLDAGPSARHHAGATPRPTTPHAPPSTTSVIARSATPTRHLKPNATSVILSGAKDPAHQPQRPNAVHPSRPPQPLSSQACPSPSGRGSGGEVSTIHAAAETSSHERGLRNAQCRCLRERSRGRGGAVHPEPCRRNTQPSTPQPSPPSASS